MREEVGKRGTSVERQKRKGQWTREKARHTALNDVSVCKSWAWKVDVGPSIFLVEKQKRKNQYAEVWRTRGA